MGALVVDIETAGEVWENFDEQTKHMLVEKFASRFPESDSPEDSVIQELGLSPLTGEIVALGIMDVETGKGAVYFQAPGKDIKEKSEGPLTYRAMSEKAILEKFWEISDKYTEFVTFNGRTFDFPYIMLRSAAQGVKPLKDITRARYLYQQAPGAVHIDLYDQMTFYGSMRAGSLHMFCRAFGIDTPKNETIDGSKVGEFYHKGAYEEIAEYNGRDLEATRQLYLRWKKLLSFK